MEKLPKDLSSIPINRKNKTFILPSGREIPIPEEHINEMLRTPYSEKIHKEAREFSKKLKEGPLGGTEALSASFKEAFLGNLPEKGINLAKAGYGAVVNTEGREGLGALERLSDEYLAREDARKESLQELEQEYPTMTGIGGAMGTVGELATLGKVPGVAAFPIMGAAHSETPLTDPVGLGEEALGNAGLGLVVDKFMSGLGKVASARAARNAAKEGIANVEASNLAETERALQANKAEQGRFAQETSARNAEIERIKGLQEAENKAFVKSSSENIGRISKAMGKYQVPAEAIGVEEFLENEVGRSANAMAPEAKSSGNFLRSIFKPNAEGKLTGEHIQKGIKALDEAIVNSEGTSKQILSDYRTKVLQELPSKMTDSYISEKWGSKIADQIGNIEKDLAKGFVGNEQVYRELAPKLGTRFAQTFTKEAQDSVKKVLGSVRGDFLNGIQSPDMATKLSGAIKETPSYQRFTKELENYFSKNTGAARAFGATKEEMFSLNPSFKALERFAQEYPEVIAQKAIESSRKFSTDIFLDASKMAETSEKAIDKIAKQHNVLPQPTQVAPLAEVTPNLQQVPDLAPPRGIYERLGAGLEQLTPSNAWKMLKRHGTAGGIAGSVAHMAGVPIAKIGTLAGLGGLGLKGLTSPTVAGELIRKGISRSTRVAFDINQAASKYSSYHDGILDDPNERRSLTKEIEDARDIPIDQKALMQSKINRGKSLEDRLI